MSDERLRRGADDDLEIQRVRADGKPDGRSARYTRPDERKTAERAMATRAMTDAREDMTDDDRLALLASSALETVLPALPDIPGYSIIWLTTSNPNDSIARRMALGYEPVKPEDVPGFENLCVKAGEHAGFISCREMLAFKIRKDLQLKYLELLHHQKPAEEAEKLADQVTEMRDGRGRPIGIIEGEGLQRETALKGDFSHMM